LSAYAASAVAQPASTATPSATAARKPTAVKEADHAHDDHDHDHGHGHDDHEHAHMGHDGVNTDPSEVKGDLAIFSAVVFLLLVVILRKFAWGPISQGLEKREHHIAHEIAAAEKANADAKMLLADYQKKLDASHAEVKAILEEARRDAEQTRQDGMANAGKEAALIIERGKREIDDAKDAALRELAQVATDQALALAGKLLQQKLQPADHARLIEDSLAKFPKTKANLN
jgi:F-type H+-transporting ATPase subunit b